MSVLRLPAPKPRVMRGRMVGAGGCKREGSMDKLHRCEAMPADVEIWRPPQRRGRWRLYVMRGFCYIRYCPFCGVELGEGEDDHA